MREIIKLGLMLLLITSVAAVILGLTNGVTSGIIEEVEAKATEEAQREVLPEADSFKAIDEQKLGEIKDKNAKVIEISSGFSKDQLVGYTIKTVNTTEYPGYGGDVEMIVGISTEGEITGLKVLKHQETPGLGANATKPEFQNQYKGKATKEDVIVVKTEPSNANEIQALTGATITSDAVTSGVNNAREIFNNLLMK